MTARKAGVILVLLTGIVGNLQGQFSQGGLTIWGSYSNGATNVPAGLTNVVAISAAGNFTTVLRADGTVAEWGTASAPYGPRPSPPAGLNQVMAISTGPLSSGALKLDGTAREWGYYSGSPPFAGIAGVAANQSILALRTDGTVAGWDATFNTNLPAPTGLKNVVAISAATQGWLALRADGTVAAWDYLYQGPRPLPLPPGLTNLVAITSGLGLRSDGTVAAWNYNGQALSPPNDWTNLVAIAGWGSPYLGLRANGTVLAWGSSFAGQTNVPPALTNVVAIAAGANFAVALSGLPPGSAPPQFIEPAFLTATVDYPFQHHVAAKNGVNAYGAAGLPAGMTLDAATGLLAGTPSVAGISQVSLFATNDAGTAQATLKIYINLPQPTIRSYGLLLGVPDRPFEYQVAADNHPDLFQASGLPPGLVLEPATGRISGVPAVEGEFPISLVVSNRFGTGTGLLLIRVSWVVGWGHNYYGSTDGGPGLTNVVALAARYNRSVALRRDGTVMSWPSPTFPDNLNNVRAIAVGAHNLALRTDGTVVDSGTTYNGGTSMPPGLNDVIAIAAGVYHGLAVRLNGAVVGWGDDSYGQISIPADLNNVIAVAGGSRHSLALRADGTVSAWGDNSFHQTEVPPGLSNVTAIAAGYFHNLALRTNGTVVAWGDNPYGQADVPPGLSNVVAVAAGVAHSLALLRDGTVAAWGENDFGEATVPAGLTNVAAIAAGDDFNLALLTPAPPRLRISSGGGQLLNFEISASVGSIGRPHALQSTTNLGSPWATVWSGLLSNTNQTIPWTNSAGARFFRVSRGL